MVQIIKQTLLITEETRGGIGNQISTTLEMLPIRVEGNMELILVVETLSNSRENEKGKLQLMKKNLKDHVRSASGRIILL